MKGKTYEVLTRSPVRGFLVVVAAAAGAVAGLEGARPEPGPAAGVAGRELVTDQTEESGGGGGKSVVVGETSSSRVSS